MGGGTQDAGAAREAHRALREARGVQDMGGGERGVPAEVDLGGGREPAQCPVGLTALREPVGEGGLRQVDLRGDALEAVGGGEVVGVEEQHSGGVPGEGPVGERVDDADLHGPDRMPGAFVRSKANSGWLACRGPDAFVYGPRAGPAAGSSGAGCRRRMAGRGRRPCASGPAGAAARAPQGAGPRCRRAVPGAARLPGGLVRRRRAFPHGVDQRPTERAMRKPTSSTWNVGWLRRRAEARQLQCSSNQPPPRSTR